MIQRFLKPARVILALAFFLIMAAFFVDFNEIMPVQWTGSIFYLQFIPSLIRFLTIPAFAAAGCIVVLLLTLAFGRVYCSVICPLGIFQDFFTRFSLLTRLTKRFKYTKALNWIRYPVLGLTLLSLLVVNLFVIMLLDPYSSFGRVFSGLFRPLLVVINNGTAGLLERFDWYFISRLDPGLFTWHVMIIPILTWLVVVSLALFFGRLYCNTICPVGTLLGLLSRMSLLRISMRADTCTRCGKCVVACKANCIQIKTLEVDFSRCVACFNCIRECPENSIKYHWLTGDSKGKHYHDKGRRGFLTAAWLMGASALGFACATHRRDPATKRPAGNIPNHRKYPVSPPGSTGIQYFKDHCTACHLCVSVCPTHVLQPAFLEYGWTGMAQPFMDYATEYCNYECVRCTEVCPSGALLPLTVEDKKLEQIGQVELILSKCIVVTDLTACGSCSEHCPTQAVRMIPYLNDLTVPAINPKICIGCGACEFACPVKPFTAIFVNGNPVHQVAEPPAIEELKIEETDDFPF